MLPKLLVKGVFQITPYAVVTCSICLTLGLLYVACEQRCIADSMMVLDSDGTSLTVWS